MVYSSGGRPYGAVESVEREGDFQQPELEDKPPHKALSGSQELVHCDIERSAVRHVQTSVSHSAREKELPKFPP